MKEDKKGFTLTEVLVVIVIIGIVLTIAIPSVVLIRRRINTRMYEEKKHLILVSAELYAKDKSIAGSTLLTIDDLLEEGYITPDLKNGEGDCTNPHGCIVDPDGNIINDIPIKIKDTSGNNPVAIWVDTENCEGSNCGAGGDDEASVAVDKIKELLNCPANIPADEPCLFPSDATNNFIYINGIMWRVVGVYNIDSHEVLKLITDDTVVWEES